VKDESNEQISKGHVMCADKNVAEVPVQKRGVGFMFQSFALFKHMTVGENIAFGPRIQKQDVDLESRYPPPPASAASVTLLHLKVCCSVLGI